MTFRDLQRMFHVNIKKLVRDNKRFVKYKIQPNANVPASTVITLGPPEHEGAISNMSCYERFRLLVTYERLCLGFLNGFRFPRVWTPHGFVWKRMSEIPQIPVDFEEKINDAKGEEILYHYDGVKGSRDVYIADCFLRSFY
eukprot:TRINITY_DN13817_c0_g2_i4.p1 TRINITY_DN13817_c0_g2~~TRINITY_DN13817_c0_g2_i4.p1  ORF type:complete len:141 (-),score=25.73 TRINITY_DN13817_c0_g2_i4:725-1147(-)